MARRELQLDSLSDVVNECNQLLDSGYVQNGNWSLGQMCHHIRLTIDASIDGYPRWMSIAWPIRPLFRWLMLEKLLSGNSPSGVKTAGVFVPPKETNDADQVAALASSVSRFRNHDGYLHPHPGFGKFDHESLDQFHAAHAAHHLGFLSSKTADTNHNP